jgi:CheY-like chemotaxis protein
MATILIVDDNPLDRQLAAGFLEPESYNLEFAEHGDLDMPELNGLELVEALNAQFPLLPVILMTAKGSEEIAATALKSGAASYVPKRTLGAGLIETVRIVLDSARTQQLRKKVFGSMISTESNFELSSDPTEVTAMVDYLRDALDLLSIVPEDHLTRISTALTEALINAMDHGNLELDSRLIDGDDPDAYRRLRAQRMEEPPFANRRLLVHSRLNRLEAVFTIVDEGPGFDISKIPDPTDPDNLMRAHGRGLLLIRTFIPDVTFNERGNEVTLRIPKETTDSSNGD